MMAAVKRNLSASARFLLKMLGSAAAGAFGLTT